VRRAFLLFTTLLLLALPLYAQDDDPQTDLEALVREYVVDDAALAVQVTTPDGSWTATGGQARPDQPTAPDDRFRIASMSKTYVAVVTLLLAEEGVFSLDDLASEWLPDEVIEKLANADSVTIRQLLSMRSGIPDYLETEAFWGAVEANPTREWTAQSALAYAYAQPALFAPDEEFYYSNSNYLLMQLVLEAAAEKPLYVLTREYLLDPLQLEDTYTQISETLPGGFVESYLDFDGDGKVEEVSQFNDGAGLGDGALISNTADITAFYQALLQDQTLLNENSMAELLNFQFAGEEGSYSIGLAAWEEEVGAAWGHSGGVVGFSSLGVYLPDQDIIIVILSASMELDVAGLALDAIDLFVE
jgi:D-alanyl-D-alanine carboxypeptidase